MKPDKLEQFILDNRDGFDDLDPSPASWEKVKQNIKVPARTINWTNTLVRVAAAVVIFVASYIFIDYTLNKDGNAGQLSAQQDEFFENLPVLVEARAYYSSQIASMETEVYRLAGQDSPIKADIQAEFEELDEVFNELKADLNDDAANEEVIEAMIQNYRLKLRILEEILYQLKNADDQNNTDNEDKKIIL